MSFISPCIKIRNLANLNTSQTICCDNYSLFLVTDGAVTATAGKKVYQLEIGDIMLADKREICFIRGKGRVEGFSFDTDDEIPFGAKRIDANLISLLGAIGQDTGPTLYPLLELLLCNADSFEEIPSSYSRDIALFADAVDVLCEYIEGRISVEELAEELRISLSHLKRIFSAYAGVGAHDYFNLLKICKAKELLLDGESVTLTAEKTGFANQAYFSAAFKRIAGISPKDFAGSTVKRRPVGRAKIEAEKRRRNLPDHLL